MKRLFYWFYIQAYVSTAVLFLSKKRLMEIASSGGNHPLVILQTARWARIWWFSLLGIAIWFVFGTPFFKLILTGNETTFYSYFHHPDKITFFNEWTFNVPKYLVATIVSGKLLQALEIISCNKMEYFRKYISYGNRLQSEEKHKSLSY